MLLLPVHACIIIIQQSEIKHAETSVGKTGEETQILLLLTRNKYNHISPNAVGCVAVLSVCIFHPIVRNIVCDLGRGKLEKETPTKSLLLLTFNK